MPFLQAYGRIQVRVREQCRGIPRVLKARLERTCELISPNELTREILTWKCCAQCGDSGTVGNVIDKTLAFCGCPAGGEVAYSKGGDNWPTQEIARVHADSKSMLVAACFAIGLQLAADAITDSEVTDNGGTLQVHVSDSYFRTPEGDIHAAVKRLGWQRRILITGGSEAKRQPAPAPAARQEAAPSARPPSTQADVGAEVAKRWQKIPPQLEDGCDLAARVAVGGVE